jgi:hypothetical protein
MQRTTASPPFSARGSSVSYDLYFWRESVPQTQTPEAICDLLCADEEPAGVSWLSVDEIKAHFAATFPGIEDAGTELNWEGEGSYFQVTWPVESNPRHTLAIFGWCGYDLLKSTETMNRIIAVASSLGCALYDPQTSKRYKQPEPTNSG